LSQGTSVKKIEPTHLDLDQQLCFALYRASRAIIRTYGPLLKPLGLTYAQYLVMLVLWNDDNISVKEIGDKLALDSATLTPLLKKLEQQKIVTRERAIEDERVVQIKLTKQGHALKIKAHAIPGEIACRGGFDVTKKSDIQRIIALRSELQEIAKRYSH
jgi:DNA-binding MarR family transcriptional regulator